MKVRLDPTAAHNPPDDPSEEPGYWTRVLLWSVGIGAATTLLVYSAQQCGLMI